MVDVWYWCALAFAVIEVVAFRFRADCISSTTRDTMSIKTLEEAS